MQAYLDQHYCSADGVADRCGIEPAELERLLDDGLVPRPSYTVTPDKIVSAAFGDLPRDGAAPGRYFAPSQTAWVARAQQAGQAMKGDFRTAMEAALAEADRAILRLEDAFDDDGTRLSGLDARLDNMWANFINGVFALCVANADTEAAIARKEILQEKLSAVTADGTRIDGLARGELTQLVDAYAAAAMPFAPAEFPRSSRKRLVDDVRAKLALRGTPGTVALTAAKLTAPGSPGQSKPD